MKEDFLKKYNLDGYIPSPPDDRDYTVDMAVEVKKTFPEEYLPVKRAKVLDQKSIGSCVAHAIATTMVYAELHRADKKINDYSRGFIYGNRRIVDHQGEGLVTRQALKNLNHDGDCLFSIFPWNEKYPDVKMRIAENHNYYYAKAAPFQIANYFRLYNADDIKTAIMERGACVICIDVYPGFSKDVKLPEPGAKKLGGHAMCCIGWNKTGWIVQNSWSKNWGDYGLCYIPFEYPIREAWGISLGKGEIKKTFWQKVKEWFKRLLKKIFGEEKKNGEFRC